MKYIISILFFVLVSQVGNTQLIVNEIMFESNEIELKNLSSSSVNLIGTNIQSSGSSMFITDATNISCSGFNLMPGGKVVVPIPYPIFSSSGDLFVFENGQTPSAYVQWGGVQGFATLAFAEGLWDDAMTFVPGNSVDKPIILIDKEERKNPSGWLTIGEASPCNENDQCEISDVEITDITCNDNGTSSDPTDDFFTFYISVKGVNLPERLFLTSSVGVLEPSILYEYELDNVFITSYDISGTAALFDLDISAENGMCNYDASFDAPSTCSPNCEMQFSQFITLGCMDNNTVDDPSDDYIEFIVKPFGFNLAEEYFLEFSFGNVEGPFINEAPFSVISSEGFYVPGSGDFWVRVIDGGDSNCEEVINVTDQENCSPECLLNIDSLAVRCDDGGTPYDDTDDFYTVDVQMSTSASASTMFQASIDPFLAGPQMLEYGELHSFSSAPGSTGAINAYAMTLIDPAYPSCTGVTLNGFLNEGCLTECEIFAADIAIDQAPLICLEPDDESIISIDVINGIEMDTFLVLALDENDDIVFITDKLQFDAREFDAATYQFVLVHFFDLDGAELGADIDRLEGCFALSPFVEIEIRFEEKCTTATEEKHSEFLVYPNPVDDLVCLKYNEDIYAITILDIEGRTLVQSQIKSCLDVSGLAKGVYFIRIETQTRKSPYVHRIVKM